MPIKPPLSDWPARRSWAERDLSWSLRLHRGATQRPVLQFFVVVSRLGNGGIWYALIALLPWFGPEGIACGLRMTGVGLVNLVIYKALKRCVARPRPYDACSGICARTPALDVYSFPSGHTLHAVGFSVVFGAYFPVAAIAAWCFTLLVGASRLVLGLHYPSDVVAGATIGVATSTVMFCLF